MRNKAKAVMVVVLVLFVLSSFAVYGLYFGSDKTSGGVKDYAVAEVNGSPIMRSDLERVVYNMAQQYKDEEITSKDILGFRKKALEVLVIQKEDIIIQNQIQKDIKSRKIKVDKDKVETGYAELMDTFPTREEFKVRIESMGITEKQIKDEIEQKLMKEKLWETIGSEIVVSDKEALTFYELRKKAVYGNKDYNEVSADVIADVKDDKLKSQQTLYDKKILNEIDVKIVDKEIFDVVE